jgi:hypothetical protein
LQPAPDLDAQIGRLGRKLMDQQQPTVGEQSGRIESTVSIVLGCATGVSFNLPCAGFSLRELLAREPQDRAN